MTSREPNHPEVQAAQESLAAAAEADLPDCAVAIEDAAAALERALADEGPGDSGPASA